MFRWSSEARLTCLSPRVVRRASELQRNILPILPAACHYFLLFLFILILAPPLQAAGREEAAAKSAAPRLAEKLGSAFTLGDPVFMRIIKDEAILELWLRPENSKKFKLFHRYPICAYSGDLGPKTREGDRQAPEGFYAVGPKHLNPFSNYHLSFDLGYPNQYDRSQGYSGSLLMVHGNCLSDGCYAMTDPAIEEIYTLAKAALDRGQPFFRVHVFPFRLTAKNLARYTNSPWYDFWRMMEPVYVYFEKHGFPPDISMDKGRYEISEG